MTEIQFLLDLALNHKLAKPVHDKILARIGEVEARLSQAALQGAKVSPLPVAVNTQSPSTQRILSQMVADQVPIIQPAPAAPIPVTQQKFNGDKAAVEVVSSVTPGGGSTRGPRKW